MCSAVKAVSTGTTKTRNTPHRQNGCGDGKERSPDRLGARVTVAKVGNKCRGGAAQVVAEVHEALGDEHHLACFGVHNHEPVLASVLLHKPKLDSACGCETCASAQQTDAGVTVDEHAAMILVLFGLAQRSVEHQTRGKWSVG